MPIALSVGLRLLLAALFVLKFSSAVVPGLKQMPIAFEPNQGQFETGIQFGSPNNGGQQIWIYSNRICIKSKNATVELYWRGGNSSPKVEGATKLPGTSNYILGRDHRNWRLGVPQFKSVRLLSIYEGIDLVVYGHDAQIEYDLTLSPGANIDAVDLHFSGIDKLTSTPEGGLIAHAGDSTLLQHPPRVFQDVNGRRIEVPASYQLRGTSDVSFRLGHYQRTKPLVVDPVLSFSAMFGGTGSDRSSAVAVDSSGCIYITGDTSSTDFPVAQPYETAPSSAGNSRHIFVTKLNATASAVLFSTYLGGSAGESGRGITVDASGNVYITGSTVSSDYPVTQATVPISEKYAPSGQGNHVVLTKLSPTGSSLVYSAVLGGSGDDEAAAIAIDGQGNAVVTGTTNSPDFPTTVGAHSDLTKLNSSGSAAKIFVLKVNASGTAFAYSSVLGGTGVDESKGLAIDGAGNVYIAGATTSADFPVTAGAVQAAGGITGSNTKAFLAELCADGSRIVFATYLGGSASEQASGVALDYAGHIFLTGLTTSSDFPVTPGSYFRPLNGSANAVFVTKLKNDGSAILYSSLFGGMNNSAAGITIDSAGNALVAGTVDYGFEVTYGAPQILPGDGAAVPGTGSTTNAFLLKLNNGGTSAMYATYLGGVNAAATGVAVAPDGTAIVTGTGDSTFTVTPNTIASLQSGGVFVAAVSDAAGCSFTVEPLTPLSASVAAPEGCSWIAVPGSPWIGISSGKSGSGNGTVQLVAAQNEGVARAGVVSIAGKEFVVSQPSGCSLTLSAAGANFPAAGGSGQFSGSIAAGCPVPPESTSSGWIHVSPAPSGASYWYTVDSNTTSQARAGVITLGVRTFYVNQAAFAATTPIAFSTNVPGGSLTVAGVGCQPGTYTLPVTLPWSSGASCNLQILAPGGYSLAGWTDGETAVSRTIVAGASLVTLGVIFSRCTYSIQPPNGVGKAAGDSLTIIVSTEAGCPWSVSSSAPWISGNGSRTGSGSLVVTLANNPGTFRKAVITIAAMAVPIKQAGITYPTVFRPTTGTWFVSQTASGSAPAPQQWGLNGDVPVAADYDGDGQLDYAVWRPATGYWYVIPSSHPSAPIVQQWGLSGDVPVPRDYDGDGKADLAVWRPANGSWYIVPSSAPGSPRLQQWGLPGDIPVPADYDGDGKADVAVWRPASGMWYIVPSTNTAEPSIQQWGMAGDIPVPADYDGDGKADIAVWRPSSGVWCTLPSATPTVPLTQQWGAAGDIPVPADYDGDGQADRVLWRPVSGVWYTILSANPSAAAVKQWGINGDIPAAGNPY